MSTSASGSCPTRPFRLQRPDRRLDGRDLSEIPTYEEMLRDRAGHPNGIGCYPDLDAVPPAQDATIPSVVTDPGTMTTRLGDGKSCETGYRTIVYADFLGGRSG